MATVIRRRTLVNPARRRRRNRSRKTLSAKQIRFFGTPAQKAALKRSRSAKRRRNFSLKKTARKVTGLFRTNKHRVRRRSRRRARRNISAIVTAGLPFGNPHRRRRKKARKNMAKSKTHRRRRSHAHRTHRRRRSNPVVRRRRRRTYSRRRHNRRRRHNPVMRTRRRRYSRRRHHARRRHNPRSSMTSGLVGNLIKGGYVVGGAVGSRWLTQVALSMLGQSNSGIIGYGGNVVSTLLLGWASGKFLGRGSRSWVIAGGMAGLVLRFLQDQTSFGKMFSLSGMGDPGVGVLLPSSFADPALFTGQGAQRRIPGGWQAPAAVPARSGMGWSTYGTSTYR